MVIYMWMREWTKTLSVYLNSKSYIHLFLACFVNSSYTIECIEFSQALYILLALNFSPKNKGGITPFFDGARLSWLSATVKHKLCHKQHREIQFQLKENAIGSNSFK